MAKGDIKPGVPPPIPENSFSPSITKTTILSAKSNHSTNCSINTNSYGKTQINQNLVQSKPSYLIVAQGCSQSAGNSAIEVRNPTFASSSLALHSALDVDSLTLKPITLYQGIPSVLFPLSEKQVLVDKLKFVLVGKFSHGMPRLHLIKKFFADIKLKKSCSVSLFDKKHIFIECFCGVDYDFIWLHLSWVIDGFTMRVLKWTADFNPTIESAIVPVWVRLEGLPLYMFDEISLLSIANSIGKPIKVDPRNVARTIVNSASICVELDVSKPLMSALWVSFEDDVTKVVKESFRVKLVYDFVPQYCGFCSHLGHCADNCKRVDLMNEPNQNAGMSRIMDKIKLHEPRSSAETVKELKKAEMRASGDDYICSLDGGGTGPIQNATLQGQWLSTGKEQEEAGVQEEAVATGEDDAGRKITATELSASTGIRLDRDDSREQIKASAPVVSKTEVGTDSWAVTKNSGVLAGEKAGCSWADMAEQPEAEAVEPSVEQEVLESSAGIGIEHVAEDAAESLAEDAAGPAGWMPTAGELGVGQATVLECTGVHVGLLHPDKNRNDMAEQRQSTSADLVQNNEQIKTVLDEKEAALVENETENSLEQVKEVEDNFMQGYKESWADRVEKAEEEGVFLENTLPVVSQDEESEEDEINGTLADLHKQVMGLKSSKKGHLVEEEEKQKYKKQDIRITSQLSPSEVKDCAKKELAKVYSTPTSSLPSLTNLRIPDKDGNAVPIYEILEKSARVSELSKDLFKFRNMNESLKGEHGLDVLKTTEYYDRFLTWYTIAILQTLKDHSQTSFNQDSTTDKVTPPDQDVIKIGLALDDQEWTTPKRRGRERNKKKEVTIDT